jgi:hypothetical protein
VLTAFALTTWLLGPRALDVLAARYQDLSERSPLVQLDRVGVRAKPDWLQGPLLLAVSKDLAPALQDQIAILDEPAARDLQARLQLSPWVRGAVLAREFPDRFRVDLELRRPVLAVRTAGGEPLCLVDRDGTALPWFETDLPTVRLHREGGAPTLRFEPGRRVDEPRVVAAAAIAVEWRDELAPRVSGCPRLLEVDTTNLGESWMRGRGYPEVRVILARSDGHAVVFCYGRPVGSPLPRVAVQTKALVLSKILARAPGLAGLVAGDLRFKNRWADYLQPRAAGVPDPDGPWSALEADPAAPETPGANRR